MGYRHPYKLGGWGNISSNKDGTKFFQTLMFQSVTERWMQHSLYKKPHAHDMAHQQRNY